MRTALIVSLALQALAAGGNSSPPRGRVWQFNYENVLGTSLELKIEAGTASEAERADAAVRREIEREAGILSAWDSSSEFSRWVATTGQPVRLSPELFEMLSLFDAWRDRTGGALDAAAETVVRAWKAAAQQGREPSRAERDSAVEQVRQPHWKLDRASQTATHLDQVPIALNSFAKSYIVDHAANAALTVSGVSSAVVNIGGDLVIRGPRAESVDIADPRCDAENCQPLDQVKIRNRAIVSSGSYRRGVEIAGRHYSHIVDPRTGLTAETIISSTVVAPDPADAGAMATAFSVLQPEESRRIAASIPGAEFLLISSSGERIASAGWAKLALLPRLRGAADFVRAAAPSPNSWDSSFELTITLELTSVGFFAHRPYLAVWVEDGSRKPVRTIALWYNKDRYLPEMRAWYRVAESSSGQDAYSFAHSVSSATRSPGKYTLKWDGRDDAGKPVAAGRYTIFVETAREHGTYQLMRQAMDFNGMPGKIDLKGNTEIAGATLDYHKIAHR
jgi:thiamine biosynthesis lipoprotein ApbE